MSKIQNHDDEHTGIKRTFAPLGRTMADFDPDNLEVEPGLRVGELKTTAECTRAQLLLQTGIDGIMAQISLSEEEAKAGQPREHGWRTRAQGAIRWKRRTIAAINDRIQRLPKAPPQPPSARVNDRRHVILQTIEDEIGRDEMERLVQLARSKRPELWEGAE